MTATVACALAFFLPGKLKCAVLRRWLNWDIAPSARIGFSFFVNVTGVHLSEGARIGHFNVFWNLRGLELGERSEIGQWNWITAAAALLRRHGNGLHGRLALGDNTSISSRHYLDCSGGITVGSFTVVAGVRTTFLTHQIDVNVASQTLLPVRVGDYCLVSSNVRVTPGSVVGDRCVLAMGAVVVGELTQPRMLYAGVPAKPVKELGDAAFFDRLNRFGGDAVWYDTEANS